MLKCEGRGRGIHGPGLGACALRKISSLENTDASEFLNSIYFFCSSFPDLRFDLSLLYDLKCCALCQPDPYLIVLDLRF